MNDALQQAVKQRLQQLLSDLGGAQAAARAQAPRVPDPAALPPREVVDQLGRQDAEAARRAAAWLDAERKRLAQAADDGKAAVELLGRAAAAVKALLAE